MRRSPDLTVYAAIWTDQRVASRCLTCGQRQKLDLRRLAIDGHGCKRLSAIPFHCDCGASDHEVMMVERPGLEPKRRVTPLSQPPSSAMPPSA